MRKVQYIIADSRALAEMLQKIRNSGDALSFATCYETDEDGEISNQNTDNWWGMKFLDLYDGTCVLVGNWGGGAWYTFDATSQTEAEELVPMIDELFRNIEAKEVCVEVESWV